MSQRLKKMMNEEMKLKIKKKKKSSKIKYNRRFKKITQGSEHTA